jgi:hypothetical protein
MPRHPLPQLKLVLTKPTSVRLTIVGPDGRAVRTLVKDEKWEAGPHAIAWDGKDNQGRLVPPEAYVPFVEAQEERKWAPVFNPNAKNHGLTVEATAVEWNRTTGHIVVNVPSPMRLKAWIVAGDDGCILKVLKDMEPASQGMLLLDYRGVSPFLEKDLAKLGHLGGHFKGYALPECSLILVGEAKPSYLEVRARYSIIPEASPRAYPDSNVLYRYPYELQKAIRFRAGIDGKNVTLTLEKPFDSILNGKPLKARIFAGNTEADVPLLQEHPGLPLWKGMASKNLVAAGALDTVVINTEQDQFGAYRLSGEQP